MDKLSPRNDESDSDCVESIPVRKTVLLVDDDAKLLRGLKRMLAEESYELLTAVSAPEARAILSSQVVDLIVSDNLMPGMLGTDFLAEVRRDHPHITLMLLSGYIPESAARRLVEETGIFCVLTKPCNAKQLAVSIREALAVSHHAPM